MSFNGDKLYIEKKFLDMDWHIGTYVYIKIL